MDRAEADAIYDQGRDVVARVLMELSAQNERLVAQVESLTARVARQEGRIAQLERQTKRSSRNSSQRPVMTCRTRVRPAARIRRAGRRARSLAMRGPSQDKAEKSISRR